MAKTSRAGTGDFACRKLPLSVLDCVHAPGQSFHHWHFLDKLAPFSWYSWITEPIHASLTDFFLRFPTDLSIRILYVLRYSEIFMKKILQAVKRKANKMFSFRFTAATGEPIWDPGVFTIIIILFPYWWLSYNKLFYLFYCLQSIAFCFTASSCQNS